MVTRLGTPGAPRALGEAPGGGEQVRRGKIGRWWHRLEGGTKLRLGALAVFAIVVGAIWLTEFFLDASVDAEWKFVVGSLLAGVGAAAIIAAIAFTRRRSETLERWIYALGWLTAASLFPIAVTVLDPNAQGWGLTVLVAWLLALLPGFLYLQFRTVRGLTLLEEYVQHLRRLEIGDGALPDPAAIPPPAPEAPEVDVAAHEAAQRNLYVRKFRSVFGRALHSEAEPSGRTGKPGGRMRGDTLWPVLWVTVLVAIGWSAVLAPATVFDWRPFGREFSLPNASGAENAIRFGFLGAYFYVVQMLVRRYFQKDLKPDAYVSAILRLVTVPLVVIAVHTIGFTGESATSQETELAIAFVLGIFPQVGLEAIREVVARVLGGVVPSLRADYPLSQIDGLNLFYQSRLLEEGIEDMQNLATADFADLLLQTRIPVGRMVDWMDQAHLLVRLPTPTRTKLNGVEASSERKALRDKGIRCATDLELAATETSLRADLKAALPGLEFVLRTLRQEPNMQHVRAWKRRKLPPPPPAQAAEDAA